ncbi:Family of unknown function (DUF500) domain containing protein [Elaphomyces granulatus]
MSQRVWKDYSIKGWGDGKKRWHQVGLTLDRRGAGILGHRLSNWMSTEPAEPPTLVQESDQAARILSRFCGDGFSHQDDREAASTSREENGHGPAGKEIDRAVGTRTQRTIPAAVIRRAKGLAIFTIGGAGGSGGGSGSGVLLARIAHTGEWSPPSSIRLHCFQMGVDRYDGVVVVNTDDALEGFKQLPRTLGAELSVAAGPVDGDTDVDISQPSLWTYLHNGGLAAGVPVDGTSLIERTEENKQFYGRKVSTHEILAGQVEVPPGTLVALQRALRAAQDDGEGDDHSLPPALPPREGVIRAKEQSPKSPFGVPDLHDPDPFGVKALEREGLFIREAGTKTLPSQEAFEFRPSPTSPVFGAFARDSLESMRPREGWRYSVQSIKSFYSTVTRATQTDDDGPAPSRSAESRASSRSMRKDPIPGDGAGDEHGEEQGDPGENVEEDDFEIHEASNTTIMKPERAEGRAKAENGIQAQPGSPAMTRPRLVTIPKRLPPPLPPRHPNRLHDSVSSQSSMLPPSPSSTMSVHPEIRPLDEPLPTDRGSPDFMEVAQPKIHAAMMDAPEDTDGDRDEFHSAAISPVSDKDKNGPE